MGSLALADLSADKCVEAIRLTKQLTKKPFATNIFVHNIPEITDKLRVDYGNAKIFIEQLAKDNNLDIDIPDIDQLKINSYHEQIDAIISEE
ncbi:hypothetical protein D3C72_2359630 [compost metagenome]